MSWEHTIAKQFRNRDNRTENAWHIGNVISPVRNSSGELEGEVIISAFGGSIMLKSDRLAILEGAVLEAGQEVPLIGNPFLRAAGSQKVLVFAVPEAEVDESLLDWEVG